MREVKFRGTNGDGTWYIGDFITDHREYNRTCDKAYILPHWDKLNCPISVDPKSIGQYTGLKDKNGLEIYEGDLYSYTISYEYMVDGISQQHHVTNFVKPVVFIAGAFYHGNDLLADVIEHDDTFDYVGNIYENPELLEAK